MNKPGGYVDVDRLQAETTLEQAAAKCGVNVDIKGSGSEVRIDCPFGCSGDHCSRKEISINQDNPQKVFQCHAYSCGFRGNLLTLMHGFLTQSKPTGGKLKGDEFQRVKWVLAAAEPSVPSGSASNTASASPTEAPIALPTLRNVPLIEATDPKVQELHNIDDKFVRDVSRMNPTVASYIRRHPCLTPESMAKWRCGYLPNDGGGDKRGWSHRGRFVYPVFSEQGQILTWVGRDITYEQQERAYQLLSPAERTNVEPPAKFRFPKTFHRGIELFGQQSSRLREPGYRDFIAQHGLNIVEGFNDVIGLDNIGVPALGIMSNRMTEAQGEKIANWARQIAGGRVNLMFDCEENAIDGAKDALWFFAERKLDIELIWSPTIIGGKFKGRQPETLSYDDFLTLLNSGLIFVLAHRLRRYSKNAIMNRDTPRLKKASLLSYCQAICHCLIPIDLTVSVHTKTVNSLGYYVEPIEFRRVCISVGIPVSVSICAFSGFAASR